MDEHSDTGRIGSFWLSPSREVMGSLVLSGRDSHLRLFSDEQLPHSVPDHMSGLLHDGTRVTLIGCILTQTRNHHHEGRSRSEAEVFPHFSVEGSIEFSPNSPIVTSVSMFIEDATSLFYDLDAFGAVMEPAPIMAQIAVRDPRPRPVPVGPDAQIAYFAGQRRIASATTLLGTLQVSHCPGMPFGGPKGVAISNEVCIELGFDSPTYFHDAFDRSQRILSFLELLIGRQQAIRRQYFLVEEKPLRVHWSHAPRRKLDRHDRDTSPQPADLLVVAADQRDEFASMLKRWVETDGDRQQARQRFHSLFVKGNRFGVDRLVAAANIFDIFPSIAAGSQPQLSPDLKKACADAKYTFKALPQSYERDSVLNALGRVGKPSLKHKVKARVAVLRARAPTRFPQLEDIVELAVDCRNYFVHGTPPKIGSSAIEQLVPFLTETLEFVFACADLCDCGWSFEEFLQRGTTMSHPFGSYKVNYSDQIRMMQGLVDAAKQGAADKATD